MEWARLTSTSLGKALEDALFDAAAAADAEIGFDFDLDFDLEDFDEVVDVEAAAGVVEEEGFGKGWFVGGGG